MYTHELDSMGERGGRIGLSKRWRTVWEEGQACDFGIISDLNLKTLFIISLFYSTFFFFSIIFNLQDQAIVSL